MKDTRKIPRSFRASGDLIHANQATDAGGGIAIPQSPERDRDISANDIGVAAAKYDCAISNFTPVAQIVLDQDGVIKALNRQAAHLFSSDAAEIIGQPLQDRLELHCRDAFRRYLQKVFADRSEVDALNARLMKASGKCFDVRLISGANDLQGEPICVVAVVGSERHDARCDAHDASSIYSAHAGRVSMLGEMAAGIIHEVSHPLAVVLTYAQIAQRMLKSTKGGAVELGDLLKKIVSQAEYASAIIQRIKRFARKEEPQRMVTDINVIVRDAVALIDMELRKNAISITTTLAPDLPTIWGDPLQIQQVLVNLFHNAIEVIVSHDCQTRCLTVETQSRQADDGALEIIVRDSGPGIMPEQAEQIFQPFFTTNPAGLGLGLSLSRSIVEAHGGRLWCTPGSGSGGALHIRLPCSRRL